MSSGSFKNVIYKICLKIHLFDINVKKEIKYIYIYMYKKNLALNNF